MHNQHDIVDSALQSLAGRRWPGDPHNPELESKLMQTFDKQKSKNMIFRHPLLAACLAVLVLGSFGFAAAGGVDVIKAWIVKVEVNGTEIHDPAFEGGPVTLTITTDDNGNQTVIVTDQNGRPLDADAEITTEIVEADACTLTVTPASAEESQEDK